MKYERKPRENEMPYLINFAGYIGLNQNQVAKELGLPLASTSAWALGRYRPRDYDILCPKLKQIIEDKLKADMEEWEEYIGGKR